MDLNKPQRKMFSVLTRFCVIVVSFQLVLSFGVFVVGAQSEIAFTAVDAFDIPSTNGSIRFVTNGTYQRAVLEKGTWIFENLQFSGLFGSEKLNVSVSVTDCNVTINPFLVFSRLSRGENVTWVLFTYSVEGSGKQVFNLGLDPKKGQLDAILDGEFIGLNHGWTRSSDGTITVTADVSNVTLWYYGYPESFTGESNFLDDHYLVISSTCWMVLVLVVVAVIAKKTKNGKV